MDNKGSGLVPSNAVQGSGNLKERKGQSAAATTQRRRIAETGAVVE